MSLIDEHEQCVSVLHCCHHADNPSFLGGSSLNVSRLIRYWLEDNLFKFNQGGCKTTSIPRDYSFCGHTILQR